MHSVDTPSRTMLWRFLGAATLFWSLWQLWTVVGIFVGDVVPDDWSLDFAVPLLFGGLMIGIIVGVAAGAAAERMTTK